MNNSDTTVTHKDRRMYFMGRWFWVASTTVRCTGYVHRSDFTYVGRGNNNDRWFYADYQMTPNFAHSGRYYFTVNNEEVPF